MRRRGYTLIELLVAITIGAVLLFLTAQMFRSAIVGRERVREVSSRMGALRRAYEVVSRDLHSATIPPDDSGLQFGLESTPAGLGSHVLQFASVVGEPLLSGRASNETVLVQYAISDDPRTGVPTLFRYETAYPVPEGASPLDSGDTRAMPLLPGVTAASYLFYSPDQQNWLETWDPATGLPTAIRIDLVLGDSRERNAEQEPRQESWTFALPAAKYVNDEALEAAEAAAGTGETQ
ncbi:MAG: prepilin-type N-terminal cleavage/methylation domain-containing protein [Armatimonadota bacterium]